MNQETKMRDLTCINRHLAKRKLCGCEFKSGDAILNEDKDAARLLFSCHFYFY